jgi:hypothetical protein
MLQHTVGILTSPGATWRKLAEMDDHGRSIMLLYPLIWAIAPAAAWYFGTAYVGWSVGDGEKVRLTMGSASVISFLFYGAMVGSVYFVGYFVHWMADTYGGESTLNKGMLVASMTATPMFVLGLAGFYPELWIDLLIGVAALSWSVYLLYVGIPIIMNIPKERGFLFASALVAVSLVIFICLLVVTTIAWEYGATPQFVD